MVHAQSLGGEAPPSNGCCSGLGKLAIIGRQVYLDPQMQRKNWVNNRRYHRTVAEVCGTWCALSEVALYPGPEKGLGIYCLHMRRHVTFCWGIENYSNLICVSLLKHAGCYMARVVIWRSVHGKLRLDKPCRTPSVR